MKKEYSIVLNDWENRLKKDFSKNWLSMLVQSIFDWKKSADTMEKDLESYRHLYEPFEKYGLRIDIRQRRELVEKLSELLKKYENFEVKKYLSDECISDLEAYSKEYPDLGINKFFKAVHTQFESCRKNIKGKKISISTLTKETEKIRPDIYYRNIKPRK